MITKTKSWSGSCCACGNSFKDGTLSSSSNCNQGCSGNSAQKCGGSSGRYWSVYKGFLKKN